MPYPRYREFVDGSLDTWFKREILIHEASLLRYLSRVWPQRDEVDDLCQEIYVRIYESAQKSRPATPRAYLFALARNLVTDHLRRRRVVSIEAVGDPDALNVLQDELSPERRLTAWQELKRATRALNRLPPRCREIVWLRKVEDLSIKQIAGQLGVSARTVEGQIQKGMKQLTETLFAADAASPGAPADPSEQESQHGQR
jgi:RNA polymerase sigma factor (sigma-70 family)